MSSGLWDFILCCCRPAQKKSKDIEEIEVESLPKLPPKILKSEGDRIPKQEKPRQVAPSKQVSPYYTIKKSQRFNLFKSRSDEIEKILDEIAIELLNANKHIPWQKGQHGIGFMNVYVRKYFYERLKEVISNKYKASSSELLNRYMSEQVYLCEHRINFFTRGVGEIILEPENISSNKIIKINKDISLCEKETAVSLARISEWLENSKTAELVKCYSECLQKLEELKAEVIKETYLIPGFSSEKPFSDSVQEILKTLDIEHQHAWRIMDNIGGWVGKARKFISNNELAIIGNEVAKKSNKMRELARDYLRRISEIERQSADVDSYWVTKTLPSPTLKNYSSVAKRDMIKYNQVLKNYHDIEGGMLKYHKTSISSNPFDENMEWVNNAFDNVISNRIKLNELKTSREGVVPSYSFSERFLERYNQRRWYYEHARVDKERNSVCDGLKFLEWERLSKIIDAQVLKKESLWKDVIQGSPLFKYTESGLKNKQSAISILKNKSPFGACDAEFMLNLERFLLKDNNDKIRYSNNFFFYSETDIGVDKQKAGGTCTLNMLNGLNLDASNGMCFYFTAYRYELLYQAIFSNAICDKKYENEQINTKLGWYLMDSLKVDLYKNNIDSIKKSRNIFSYEDIKIDSNHIVGTHCIFLLSELTDSVGLKCDNESMANESYDYLIASINFKADGVKHAFFSKKVNNSYYIFDSNYGGVGKIESFNDFAIGNESHSFHKDPTFITKEEDRYFNMKRQFNREQWNELKFDFFIRMAKD
ncbi:hypothetical protein [Lelliottia wanjuensis]|uniref:hypothetical protein n=1 Tax=Lelliottia wanjuensis TaxID=3050585 RepID=UPI0025509132|nr:hypothetical protein [Lelliottia sp. V104_15]MDK9605824.1 hypothetical protein [Lelliottia sp. V104_15]